MEEEIEYQKIEQEDLPKSELYQQLAQEWYGSLTGPMAFLRLANDAQLQWVLGEIRKYIGYHAEILDVGSGAGFFSNAAAQAGHDVTGLDISRTCLKVAEMMDTTGRVKYVEGDAYRMPFPKESFDVVVAMDLFEHVSDPEKIISEMSRVLRPGGILFFRTINKNMISYFWVNKFIKWFLNNTPEKYFEYQLFRRPEEIEIWMQEFDLEVQQVRGSRPVIFQRGTWDLFSKKELCKNFRFTWCRTKSVSYTGYAKKFRDH
ncbi:bifunctional 2-polyprenyl-6-hydroxyphenol methylase/3-demethylubiquinol 3-O-methyltransferase UbiG [Bdellovibrio sp. SKB1291214]|uniref:bifunctional 2-polyprenyl-6-hydroxyphenol methylase/3-demethylubiquinol 3-O-methyltransferase UbiG n=1 Tax=Bdellovibrio sp. SKB1291214 TaxID=1732569 RepID=UPI000B518C05|nr:bifunctional 2-polyprenyl-6-hydroxyphenol methylase/3-demethylubiquinol 3-O-methyltransferase UbiG [Bdellovibrio sp. SKB1291214]UYL08588.1 bifunctional 2-polyprenyl-6-hydroxyphenol methylase/3-demethylubiquinol 3-O-methyltransferase UbiG [Bdellovibrio sp. SKB1291214]